MTTATEPTVAAIAGLCDKAAQVVVVNGHFKRHLYDPRQADGGTALENCRVDAIGALNIAHHGTPQYVGSPLVHAAEHALHDHLGVVSVTVWNDAENTTQDDVVQAFRDTATNLRAGETS